MDILERRSRMVDSQIAARGVSDPRVLDAMRKVPREAFIPEGLEDFAYDDTPLPIAEDQTISQPFIVALMVEAMGLKGGEKVLEVGAGSGYAAAVLAEIAGEVHTIERHDKLAEQARKALAAHGYKNVNVIHGDGTKGHPEAAPFDAIVVAAGGPEVPASLRAQLKVGGRLLIPVGPAHRLQTLTRVTRTGEDRYDEEDLGEVSFVPLIGQEGWQTDKPTRQKTARRENLAEMVATESEPFETIETADLGPLLDRIGDSRVVLIGEASHGTSQFYRMRARITRELIERKGFTTVAAEADWPDAARIDAWVRGLDDREHDWPAFSRFPTWMWRNAETRAFVDWLRHFNDKRPDDRRVGFHGLDMYSMYTSIGAVLDYLDDVDAEAAQVARQRYGCLTAWQHEPEVYGHAARTRGFSRCRDAVGAILTDLLGKRLEYAGKDGERLFDAEQNARLVQSAEEYYRIMYEGGAASWNLRDTHMFETLQRLLEHRGPASKAVVWAHNSHIGDASATEMAARGEHNIGQLCRERFGDGSYHIGLGTHAGTVAAATHWDGPMEIKDVRPSMADSYERLCHEATIPAFLLPLRHGSEELRQGLSKSRIERMIGVIYRPETELASHYFDAVLPKQFDEYIWFDQSEALDPLEADELRGLAPSYPFAP